MGCFKDKTLRLRRFKPWTRFGSPERSLCADVNPDRTQLDLRALFGQKDLWLEISFGGGEHFEQEHQPRLLPGVYVVP